MKIEHTECAGVQSAAINPRYRLVSCLGAGAFGEVYRAFDSESEQDIVIKVLKPEHQSKPRILERFKQEFHCLKICFHPQIVRAYDFYDRAQSNYLAFENDDSQYVKADYFFTMQYVAGDSLKEIIYKKKPEFAEAISLLLQVAEALSYIHQRKLIHRDLKPENIIVSRDGTIKLLDFGIARFEDSDLELTQTGEAVGTLYYMSPEQISHEEVDQRSDIYAFGILAYEMLTARRPFDDASITDLKLSQLIREMPKATASRAELPDWVDTLISDCTHKVKDRRCDSMQEVLDFIRSRSGLSPEGVGYRRKAKDVKNKISTTVDKIAPSIKRASLVVVLVHLMAGVWFSPIGRACTTTVLKSLFTLRGAIEAPKNVVIIAVDDQTYEEYQLSTRRPFPREYWGKLLEKVHSTNPQVVILDAYFRPEKENPEGTESVIKGVGLGPTVLLKASLENISLPDKERSEANRIRYWSDPRISAKAFMEAPLLLNARSKEHSVFELGLAGMRRTEDRFPLLHVLRSLGHSNLPTPGSRDVINFYGPPGTIDRVSIQDVIKGNYDFSNSIVFAGVQMFKQTELPNSHDFFYTSGSFTRPYFGVEIHATILSNILDASYIRRMPQHLEILFLVVTSGLFFLTLISLKPSHALLAFLGCLGVWYLVTTISFLFFHFYIPGVLSIAVCAMPILLVSTYFYGTAAENDLSKAEKQLRVKLRRNTQ